MTSDLPSLEWRAASRKSRGRRAYVSRWFGEDEFYVVQHGIFSFRDEDGDWCDTEYVDDDEAKLAAEAHFHKRLLQPMNFGEAMKAVARGCRVRWAEWDKCEYIDNDGSTMSIVYSDGTPYEITKRHITATDWHFYSKPAEPERKYARVRIEMEAWECPECQADYDIPVSKNKSSMVCANCETEIHRPKESK